MRHSRRAFMLAEVLIAMTILAAGISVLLLSIINSANLNRDTRNRSVAVFLAQRQMWALEQQTDLVAESDAPNGDSGTFDQPQFSRFRWESKVKPDERTASYDLSVTVYWRRSDNPNDDKESSLTLYSQTMMPRDTTGKLR